MLVGAFSSKDFSRDVILGKMAAQAALTYGYSKSEKGWWENTMYTLTTGMIWSPWFARQTYAFRGWGLRALGRAVLYNPVTTGVLLVFTGGYFYSKAVDPEEGADNYTGFITGGYWGNDPNYWSGDENNSGYFNAGQNAATIMDWYNAQDLAEEQAAAEEAYIQAFWDAKELKAQAKADAAAQAELEAELFQRAIMY